jgi:hypothetical protein
MRLPLAERALRVIWGLSWALHVAKHFFRLSVLQLLILCCVEAEATWLGPCKQCGMHAMGRNSGPIINFGKRWKWIWINHSLYGRLVPGLVTGETHINYIFVFMPQSLHMHNNNMWLVSRFRVLSSSALTLGASENTCLGTSMVINASESSHCATIYDTKSLYAMLHELQLRAKMLHRLILTSGHCILKIMGIHMGMRVYISRVQILYMDNPRPSVHY